LIDRLFFMRCQVVLNVTLSVDFEVRDVVIEISYLFTTS